MNGVLGIVDPDERVDHHLTTENDLDLVLHGVSPARGKHHWQGRLAVADERDCTPITLEPVECRARHVLLEVKIERADGNAGVPGNLVHRRLSDTVVAERLRAASRI